MKFYLILGLLLMNVPVAAQWELRMGGLPPGGSFQAVTVTKSGPAWVASGQSLWKSSDFGRNWTPVPIPIQHGVPWVLVAVNPGAMIYCTGSGKILRTTNGGSTWAKVFDDSTVTGFFNDMEMLDSLHGYAIGDPPDTSKGPGLVWTSDGGETWISVTNDLPKGDIQYRGRTDFINVSTGWTKVLNDGIYKTTDGGQRWNRIYSPLAPSNVFFLNDSAGFFASYVPPGLFKSTDGGVTWNQTFHGAPFEWVRWAPGGNLLWGARETLYVSTDVGGNWEPVLSDRTFGAHGGFHDACFLSDDTALVSGTGLVIGQSRDPVFVRMDGTPDFGRLELQQNYPNPFNPLTTIGFSLSSRSVVQLAIFNTLGQEVATLVQGELEAGFHEVRFDASNLPSGMYFYRLRAGSMAETRKLLLLR